MDYIITARAPEKVITITTVAESPCNGVDDNVVITVIMLATIASVVIVGTGFAYIVAIIIHGNNVVFVD
jgi:hypothetical protein